MPLTPARFPSGLNTTTPQSVLGNLPTPSPFNPFGYFNDFATYDATDWTVTSTNSGTSALSAGNGGFLTQTTGATSTNYQANELATTSFYFKTAFAQQTWFVINFNLSDTAHTLFLAGLVNTLATPMAPTKGVYFQKTDASTTLSLVLKGTGTTTVTVGTIAAATAYSVGFYYDARSTPTLYVYSSIGQTLPIIWEGSVPVFGGLAVGSLGTNGTLGTLANIPAATDALTMGFGITTGASAAHTNIVDYVGAWQDVQRF